MKANELRIGNLVQYGGVTGKVSRISHNYFQCETSDIPTFIESQGRAAKPIPLTEEWLLKFGFEINRQTKKENNIWRCYSEEGFFEVEQIGDGFFLDDNDCYGTELNYVHQLQNLYFALVREELTYKTHTDESK